MAEKKVWVCQKCGTINNFYHHKCKGCSTGEIKTLKKEEP